MTDNVRRARLDYGDRIFTFLLHERILNFGSAGGGRYFWMDGRQLRRGRVTDNFRACVDLWWSGIEQHAGEREAESESNLVLAECYPRVATSRAMQRIYVDAHLHAAADREYELVDDPNYGQVRSERTYTLPIDECERLRSIAHSRDLHRIREELDSIFLGELPPQEEMPAHREAAQAWIGNGIRALRVGGREGLLDYVDTIDEWIQRLRRRGRLDRVRLFLNMFAYECKAAFYRCYARAWQLILQWHEHYFPREVVGRRFLELWHAQNQPREHLGESRDVFCGQVLALHPLSGVVLSSPEHLAAIGNWIGHPNYETITATGRIADCSEYWDLVATILIAAHEYDHSRRRWEDSRGQRIEVDTNMVAQQRRDDAIDSVTAIFEDFAAARGIVCPECSAAMCYVRHEYHGGEGPSVTVNFRCAPCNNETAIEISRTDLEG